MFPGRFDDRSEIAFCTGVRSRRRRRDASVASKAIDLRRPTININAEELHEFPPVQVVRSALVARLVSKRRCSLRLHEMQFCPRYRQRDRPKRSLARSWSLGYVLVPRVIPDGSFPERTFE